MYQIEIFCQLALILTQVFVMVKIIVRARSSVVERIPDKNEAEGPIPSAPIIYFSLFCYN